MLEYILTYFNRPMEDLIMQKIIDAGPDTFVIFYVDGCPYCDAALTLLRNKHVAYKGYDINKINGGMGVLLAVLRKNADLIKFDTYHSTKPIIFYNGKFLGGSNALFKYFK